MGPPYIGPGRREAAAGRQLLDPEAAVRREMVTPGTSHGRERYSEHRAGPASGRSIALDAYRSKVWTRPNVDKFCTLVPKEKPDPAALPSTGMVRMITV